MFSLLSLGNHLLEHPEEPRSELLEDLHKKPKTLNCEKSTEETNITFEELIRGLNELFDKDKEDVIIEDVEAWFDRYKAAPADWEKFATWDKYRYTRNLMDEGNGKFNLMLLCWPEGAASAIHDHADSHCFLTVLKGSVREVRFHWPDDKKGVDGSLVEKDRAEAGPGTVMYMADHLGLHRVENASHSEKLVTMHCYSPPFDMCKVFDERTSKDSKVKMRFWSKFGKRLEK